MQYAGADEFASAKGRASRRQQQKELLEIEALNGALHGQDRIVVRYRLELTVPTPGPVDAHDAGAICTAERNALRCLVVVNCRRDMLSFGLPFPKQPGLGGERRLRHEFEEPIDVEDDHELAVEAIHICGERGHAATGVYGPATHPD
jgi:hypothetical protein